MKQNPYFVGYKISKGYRKCEAYTFNNTTKALMCSESCTPFKGIKHAARYEAIKHFLETLETHVPAYDKTK